VVTWNMGYSKAPFLSRYNPSHQCLALLRDILQAFKFLFTSPTSAHDINDENDLENKAPRPPKRARSQKAPTRGNVASLLGMRAVTPRSIAYVAVQVRASLCGRLPRFIYILYSCDLPCPAQLPGVKAMGASATLSFTTTLSIFLKIHRVQWLEHR